MHTCRCLTIGKLDWLCSLLCACVDIHMQSPFVICKLFKKQELNLAEEDSKSDEVEEPAVSSPTVEVSNSEVSEVTKTEDVKRLDVAESSLVISGDSHSDACDEATTAEVRILKNSLRIFFR